MRCLARMRARVVPALGIALVLMSGACASSEKSVRAAKRSDSQLSLAQKLMEQQRYAEALSHADLAIKESRKNPDAYLTRGQIEFMRAEYAVAIEDFTTARRYRPAFTEALSWRAWAYIESGDLKAAEADY